MKIFAFSTESIEKQFHKKVKEYADADADAYKDEKSQTSEETSMVSTDQLISLVYVPREGLVVYANDIIKQTRLAGIARRFDVAQFVELNLTYGLYFRCGPIDENQSIQLTDEIVEFYNKWELWGESIDEIERDPTPEEKEECKEYLAAREARGWKLQDQLNCDDHPNSPEYAWQIVLKEVPKKKISLTRGLYRFAFCSFNKSEPPFEAVAECIHLYQEGFINPIDIPFEKYFPDNDYSDTYQRWILVPTGDQLEKYREIALSVIGAYLTYSEEDSIISGEKIEETLGGEALKEFKSENFPWRIEKIERSIKRETREIPLFSSVIITVRVDGEVR